MFFSVTLNDLSAHGQCNHSRSMRVRPERGRLVTRKRDTSLRSAAGAAAERPPKSRRGWFSHPMWGFHRRTD
jgi:hypothetical protein